MLILAESSTLSWILILQLYRPESAGFTESRVLENSYAVKGFISNVAVEANTVPSGRLKITLKFVPVNENVTFDFVAMVQVRVRLEPEEYGTE